MAQLFLDCDGVLADFDSLAEQILGQPSRAAEAAIGSDAFWKTLREHERFYEKLPLLSDARILFDALRHVHPIILTGCPPGGWSEPQKQTWAAFHFPGTRMICTKSANKRDHMEPGDILVDDYLKYRHLWEQAGGVFIHHTSAGETLRQLRKIGFLAAEK
jgi:hypothetical protein